MEQAALVGQAHPVTTAIKQRQTKLLFKPGDGGEHGGMRPMQGVGRGLEAASAGDRVKASKIVKLQAIHGRRILQRLSNHSNFLR